MPIDGARDLTPRESEIAAWLTPGQSNWEISVISGVSVRTVEKHVERILQKLNVENRTAAVVALVERRLLL
jgi:DNA-binding NarL/FixJ family response regulator